MAKQKTPDPTPTSEVAGAPETYTVLARRYRPQNFEEIVGQEAVARSLTNAIKTNRVAHAYLFTGARGVGKTSTARILAKCLNCEKGPTPAPCNQCDMCKSIATGEDVDVLEIDGASNRGIDEIRNLRSNVQYRPSRARFKIYVIDEVHMLTPPAFNALLKTLEEPPPHVKFLFATTDPQKIPITILSRCQRFDLGGISLPLIKQRLAEIVAREGMQADAEALELIARRAGGSMRDAQSLLDQLLAFGSEQLTADQVHALLGTASDEHVLALAEAILSQEPRRVLDQLDQASAQGFQMGELVDQLIAYWRDLMVIHCAGTEGPDLSMASRHRDTLARQAKGLQLDTILAGLDILSTTRARLRDSSHPRTLVEMGLVRLGRLGELLSVAQLAQLMGQAGGPAGLPASTASPAATATGRAAAESGTIRVAPPEAVKKNHLSPVPEGPPPSTLPLTPETLPEVWAQVLQQVGRLLASDLTKAGLPAIFGPNSLAIRFPIHYNQAREHCQGPSQVQRVEEVLRKVLGRPCSLRVESESGSGGTSLVAPVGPVEAGFGEQAVAGGVTRPRRDPREEAKKEPLVKHALEVLGAKVVHADDDFGIQPVVTERIEASVAEDV